MNIGNPKLSMGWFPSVWIKSDNISLLNSDNSKALSLENPKLKLKLFPLLFKKVEISKLSATGEEAYFVFSKDSKFLIGEYELKLPDKKDSKFKLSKIDLDLGPYNVYLDDEKNNKNLSLLGKYLNNVKYVNNKHLSFSTENVFTVGDKSSNLYADVEIRLPIGRLTEDKMKLVASLDNFDLSSISDYSSILTGGRIKSLKGFVDISADTENDDYGHKNISAKVQTKNLAIVGQDRASSVFFDENLQLGMNFSTVENGIYIKNTTLDSENIHAAVNGKIFDLGTKAPKYNIEAEVKNTRLEDVVAILPGSEKILPDFNLYKLKKHVFYGNGEGKLKFVGQGNRPNVTGEVHLSDAYLVHPMRNATGNANVDLKFIGQRMLLDVFVPANEGQHVSVKGDVKIDGSKYSELQIKSTDAVALAPAQEILNPLREILKFQLGPVPIMKIAGYGSVDIHSAGKKVDPHIWGSVKFKDAVASFNEVHNLELRNGSGEVLFNDKNVTFKTYYATINDKLVEIKGDCVVLGKMNVYASTKGQDIQKMVKVINTSPILVDVQEAIRPFEKPSGVGDLFLHIYGIAKNAEEVVFNEDLFAKGTVTLHNAKTTLQDTFLPFTKVNGIVNFNQNTSDYDVTGYVRDSKVHVTGTGSQSEIDLVAHSDKCAIEDIMDMLHPELALPYKKEMGKIDVSFDGWYKGIADGAQLDYDKIKVDGKFLPNMNSTNPIRINGGDFSIRHGILKTSMLNGLFNNNPFKLAFSAKDIYEEEFKIADAKFNFSDFDLAGINTIKDQIKLPKDIAAQIDNIEDIKGTIDINGIIKNNSINADTNLKDTSFVYKPFGAVVRILNGDLKARNNTVYLDKINSRVSSMPMFVNGKISNIYTTPNLDLAVSAKLTQQFFDRFYNSKFVYPVKTKGDINFYTKLRGPVNAIASKSTLNLGENASIYYMGATLAGAPTGAISDDGLTTNPVSITTDAILYSDRVNLNSLKYNQTITSQNKKKSVQNQLTASGEVRLLKDNIAEFKDFRVKTENPTNARIFNVLFKKPTIKQGVFTSDLVINGTSVAPYVLGTLNINSIDIPVLDATVRDINVDFKPDFVNLTSKSVVLTNDIVMEAKIHNKQSLPVVVEDANVQMEALDLNVITKAMSDLEADSARSNPLKNNTILLEPNLLVIKNARVNADKVLIKKAEATNLKANISLDDKQVARIDDYSFNIANGIVTGAMSYDFKTLNGLGAMQIKNADAQIISENFFDMPGQMYGTVTGDMSVACTGLSSVECVNTLSGEGSFNVTDGRMPKLGSLEYLLKAGNLITGGVTGLSINGIIDLITPLKTGNFKSISGEVKVKDGVAHDINVYSSGQDLNMYMTGSYNIATLVADMEVYGSLSKNFSTIIGRIANSSLNTLFNTIPGININEINPKSTSNINKIPNFDKTKTLRVFKADIFGDINGSNYVKSFRWIKN